ncbi:MAG TPA: beta-N-acetylhexosaminidase [Bryobacteraceae bacterium]|nr:beta-N-acetylhexosaminidase [Bryobacteraceae bacterium]
MRSILYSAVLAVSLSLPILFAADDGAVIPRPVSAAATSGHFELRPDTVISADTGSLQVAQMLSRALSPATGFGFPVFEAKKAKDNAITLAIDVSLARLGDEGYLLEVTPRRIVIRAPKPAGVFYGTQSLRQLLPPATFSPSLQRGVEWRIACQRIEDSPRFAWRGVLVDPARHFLPKSDLLRFIDAAAALKLNRIQLHLTDDQGWRIEIKKYPRLTEVGSIRKETRIGHEREARGFDGRPHSGFYTQQDIREIVQFAAERYVTLVPEIEMPGHAQSAISAYPELGSVAEKLNPWPQWGVSKHIFNAGESTIVFLQDVLKEVLDLFPSPFIHVGGDEAPKDEWKASPNAQARIKELGLKDEAELQSYFIRRMDQFLTKSGRRLIGWDEILEGGLAPGAAVMSWRGTKGGIEAAHAGHDVVMAPTQFVYFDYYQSKDPGEPPAIGGFVPLDKVYGYEPVPPELNPAQAKHVLGTQAQLWSEYMPTAHQMEYMAFPRLAALAEVAWTAASRKDYASFLDRLRAQEERWRLVGIQFRPYGRK